MSENLQALLREAEDARSQRDWDTAIDKYRAALMEDPQNEDACSKLAELYAIRGLVADVIEQYFNLMDILEQKEEFEIAVEVAHWIMKLQPENDKARMKTILIYKKKGDMNEVVKQSLQLARLYIELGQGDQSILLLKNAQEIAPDNLDIGLELAEIYISHGHIQEGTNQYRKIANAYLGKGYYDKAAEAFRRMKVVVSDDPQLLFTLGNLYMQLGKYDEAESEFRAILRLNLNHTEALMALGNVCQKKGQFRDAILAFNKILSVNSQDEVAKEKLGELYHAQGATSEAVKYYLQAANTYQYGEQVDRAIKLYQRVLTVDPTNPTACRELTNLGAPLVAEDDAKEDMFAPSIAPLDISEEDLDLQGPSLEEMAGAVLPSEPSMGGAEPGEGERPSFSHERPKGGAVPSITKDFNVTEFKRNTSDDLVFSGGEERSDILMDDEIQDYEEEEEDDSDKSARKGLKKKGAGKLGGSSLRRGLSMKGAGGGSAGVLGGASKLGGGMKSKLGGKKLSRRGTSTKEKAGSLLSKRSRREETDDREMETATEALEMDNVMEAVEPVEQEIPEQVYKREEPQDFTYSSESEQEELQESGLEEFGDQIEELHQREDYGSPDFEEFPPAQEVQQYDDFGNLDELQGPVNLQDLPSDISQDDSLDFLMDEGSSAEEKGFIPEEMPGINELEIQELQQFDEEMIPQMPDPVEQMAMEEVPEQKPSGLLGRKKKALKNVLSLPEEEPILEIPEEIQAFDDQSMPPGIEFEEPVVEAYQDIPDVKAEIPDHFSRFQEESLQEMKIDDLDSSLETEDFSLTDLEQPSDLDLGSLDDLSMLESGMGEFPEMSELPSVEIPESDISDFMDSREEDYEIRGDIPAPGSMDMDIPQLDFDETEMSQAFDEISGLDEELPMFPEIDEEMKMESLEETPEEIPSLDSRGSMEPLPMIGNDGMSSMDIPDLSTNSDFGGFFADDSNEGKSEGLLTGFEDLLKLAEEIENIIPDEERIREAEERKREKDEKSEIDGFNEPGDYGMPIPTSILSDMSDSMQPRPTVMLPELPKPKPAAEEIPEEIQESIDIELSEDSEQYEDVMEEGEIRFEEPAMDEELPDMGEEPFLPPTRILEDIEVPQEIEIREEEVIDEVIEEIPGPFPEPEADFEDKIRNYLEEDNVGRALPVFTEALDKNPENYELLRAYADICYNYGLIDESLESYEKLMETDPGDMEIRRTIIKGQLIYNRLDKAVQSLVNYGNILTGEGNVEEAQRYYQHALALKEENADAREALAQIYLEQDMKQLALYHFNILAGYLEQQDSIDATVNVLKKIFSLTSNITTQEKLAEVYINHDYRQEAIEELQALAERYIQRDEHSKASINYEKIIELNPEHIEAHRKLIDLYDKLGDKERSYLEKVKVASLLFEYDELEEARQRFEECLSYKNHDHEVRRNLVEIYLKLGKLDRAMEDIKILSEVYLKERRYGEAITLYQKILGKAPGEMVLREKLAEFYVLSDDNERGLEQLMMVARHLEEQEQWDEAIKTYRKALTINDRNTEIHFLIGEIFLNHKKNVTEARYEFDKVHDLDPTHKKAMDYLVKLYLEEEKPSKAVNYLLKLIELDDSYNELKKQIIDDYKEKIKNDSEDFKSHFYLGVIYKELKKWKQAIEEFQITRRSQDYVLESHNMLGVCFAQQPSMVNLAVKTLEKGLKLKGFEEKEYIELHYNLGNLYEKTKKHKKAVDEYQAVLAIDSHYRDTVDLLKSARKKVNEEDS